MKRGRGGGRGVRIDNDLGRYNAALAVLRTYCVIKNVVQVVKQNVAGSTVRVVKKQTKDRKIVYRRVLYRDYSTNRKKIRREARQQDECGQSRTKRKAAWCSPPTLASASAFSVDGKKKRGSRSWLKSVREVNTFEGVNTFPSMLHSGEGCGGKQASTGNARGGMETKNEGNLGRHGGGAT